MNRAQLLLMTLLATPICALAQQTAAPLGIEIGKATCTQAEAAARVKTGIERGMSAWSGGKVLVMSNVSGFGVEGLQKVTVLCDAQDVVTALTLQFPKEGISGVRETVEQLDRKYKPLKRNLPYVGNAYAEWQAANAIAVLNAPHLSFSFELVYWTPAARDMFAKWEQAERAKRETKRAGSL